MFAVIESGGKQYRVEPGDVLEVELFSAKALEAGAGKTGSPANPGSTGKLALEKGSPVHFDRVLAVSGVTPAGDSVAAALQLGSPLVAGALVKASFIGEGRGPKIRIFKTKRRNTQRRTRGHRQHLHRVRIDSIELS